MVKWVNLTTGVPIEADFAGTQGQGTPIAINTATDTPYYLKAGVVTAFAGGGGGVPTSRLIDTTAPLAGGGDLTADRTLSITAATGAAAGSMSAADKTKLDAISGTNTGDQTITLTGNVTGTGTGSFAATIANDAVTYAKMQNVSVISKLLGRGAAAGVGDPEEITLGTNLSMSGTTLNASGGGSTPTGTGFTHITAGVQDAAAKLVDTADVNDAQITLAKQANMATASLVYRKTAAAGAPEINTLATLKTDLLLTGTNSGDQTITLTGNVTGSGTGSFATTIAASVVTLAMQANMATASVVYRKTAGAGAPEVQTLATLKTDLGLTGTNSGDQTITLTGDVTGSGTGSFAATIANNAVTFAKFVAAPSAGIVWAAGAANYAHNASGGGSTNFLRADGTWASPPGTGGFTAVHMNADAAAIGPAITDYFASTLSLAAASTYQIEGHANFLKTTAGTVIFTWLCSSAPTMITSRYQGVPITGFTGATITGAVVVAQATSKAVAAMAHAASGSLSTATDHSFTFLVRIRTNAATTIQLRSTESAGTITPRAGSYMAATKIV